MIPEILQKSVTRDDYQPNARNAPVLNFWVQGNRFLGRGLPAHLPMQHSTGRDDILAHTPFFENMWATSVYIAVSKMASLGLKFKGPDLRVRHLRELCMQADGGQGWVQFLQKHLRDFFLRDNGAFVEIVRASNASGSKILGIMHLDSSRCIRTGNAEIPVLYKDLKGRLHEMRDHQVMLFSDMPDPYTMSYGVGMCAAHRAYSTIYTLAALENYVSEKITGRRPLSLNFVNSINTEQIQNAVLTADQSANNRGYVSFMGAIIIPQIDPEATPSVATVQLAGLPEGFDAEAERRKAFLVYSNSLGVDPQDIDPQLLASRALGTGAQSRVIDDKASGKGLVGWKQTFIHNMNDSISPQATTFSFSESDYRDQLQKEQVRSQRTTTLAAMAQNMFITPEQGTQLLVDWEEIPPEFLPSPDITPDEELSDTTNPPPAGKKKFVPRTLDTEAGLGTRDTYAMSDNATKERRAWATKEADRILGELS